MNYKEHFFNNLSFQRYCSLLVTSAVLQFHVIHYIFIVIKLHSTDKMLGKILIGNKLLSKYFEDGDT